MFALETYCSMPNPSSHQNLLVPDGEPILPSSSLSVSKELRTTATATTTSPSQPLLVSNQSLKRPYDDITGGRTEWVAAASAMGIPPAFSLDSREFGMGGGIELEGLPVENQIDLSMLADDVTPVFPRAHPQSFHPKNSTTSASPSSMAAASSLNLSDSPAKRRRGLPPQTPEVYSSLTHPHQPCGAVDHAFASHRLLREPDALHEAFGKPAESFGQNVAWQALAGPHNIAVRQFVEGTPPRPAPLFSTGSPALKRRKSSMDEGSNNQAPHQLATNNSNASVVESSLPPTSPMHALGLGRSHSGSSSLCATSECSVMRHPSEEGEDAEVGLLGAAPFMPYLSGGTSPSLDEDDVSEVAVAVEPGETATDALNRANAVIRGLRVALGMAKARATELEAQLSDSACSSPSEAPASSPPRATPTLDRLALRVTSKVEDVWYADRPYPAFNIEIVDTTTNTLHPRVHGWTLEVTLVDGYGNCAMDTLSGQAESHGFKYTVTGGRAHITGLRFTAVSSKRGGHYQLGVRVVAPDDAAQAIDVCYPARVQVLSYRLYHSPKVALDRLSPGDSLSKVRGIGSMYAKRFANLGIETVGQLAELDVHNMDETSRREMLEALRKDRGAMTLQKIGTYVTQARTILGRYYSDSSDNSSPDRA